MAHTTHTQSTRTKIALGSAVGLALLTGLAVRVDDQQHWQRPNSMESTAVAEWARGHGLSGLSPASLTVAPRLAADLQTEVQLENAAIAQWARTEGLSGLSPASLAPSRR